jgi:hypothetical protein
VPAAKFISLVSKYESSTRLSEAAPVARAVALDSAAIIELVARSDEPSAAQSFINFTPAQQLLTHIVHLHCASPMARVASSSKSSLCRMNGRIDAMCEPPV